MADKKREFSHRSGRELDILHSLEAEERAFAASLSRTEFQRFIQRLVKEQGGARQTERVNKLDAPRLKKDLHLRAPKARRAARSH